MVKFLGERASTRKMRLYLCACSRVNWPTLEDERSRKAVDVGERFADGKATRRELRAAYRGALAAASGDLSWWAQLRLRLRHGPWEAAPWLATALDCAAVDDDLAEMAEYAWACNGVRDEPVGSALMRDIFGNPFRPPPHVAPAWLVRNDGAVKKLAEAIYEGRSFDRLPILADALEEAGCEDAELLGHLRGPGPHVKGCWALDLVLGKQ